MSQSSKRKPAPKAVAEAMPALPVPERVPRSAAHLGLNLIGLVGGVAVMLLLIQFAARIDGWLGPLPGNMGSVGSNHLLVAMVGCAVVFLIVGSGELLWRRCDLNPATGLAPTTQRRPDFKRVAVRLFGMALTLGLIAFVYWLFPEYHGSFYNPFWGFLLALAGPVAVLAIPYFIWTDTRLVDPQDGYWQLGWLVLRSFRGEGINRPLLRSHLTGWAVKGFFLPLMSVYLAGEVGSLSNAYMAFVADFSRGWYQLMYDLSYTIDLLFCVVGYAITLRLFDSHIRSTEPTAFGWIIALICYMPFYRTIGDFYLHYDDSIFWDNWLVGIPWLKALWGSVIAALVFIYGLSTVAFGLRFSNLTYRGVITSGPYRYCKHPAYVSKNLSWWLISVPWIPEHHWYEAVRNCCLIGLLNLVYYLRARTEENHLSRRDPDYVTYALWMNEHGVLAWLGRLLPFLRYKPPVGSKLPDSLTAETNPVTARG